MILVDYSGITMSCLYSVPQKDGKFDENLVRHTILNSLRAYNFKFRKQFGEMVICCDGGSWRKDDFPQYKAHRAIAREKSASTTDWDDFFRILNMVKAEIREFVPFKVVQVQKAEADDVIATIVESTQLFGQYEPTLILSADHDFIQLQKFGNVSQFSPHTKKFIKATDAVRELQVKIIKGDGGDGVPNIFSDDDTFLCEDKRQTPIRAKKLEEIIASWDDLKSVLNETQLRNFYRNRKMIELSCEMIPTEIHHAIMHEYQTVEAPHRSKLLTYLIKKRCAVLASSVADFFRD